MALKDWKKITSSQWEKNHIDDVMEPYLIEINLYSSIASAFTGIKLNNKNTYEVKIWTITENVIETKIFKTKQKALAFVKKFMEYN